MCHVLPFAYNSRQCGLIRWSTVTRSRAVVAGESAGLTAKGGEDSRGGGEIAEICILKVVVVSWYSY